MSFAIVKYFALFLLILFSSSLVRAQSVQSTVISLNTKDSIPVVYNNDLPLIQVYINNVVYNFLFDTGAGLTVLSNEITHNSNKIGNIVITGFSDSSNLFLENFTIGHTEFRNIKCIHLDLNQFNKQACVKIDGIIGANIINLLNWSMNAQSGTLYWSRTPFKEEAISTKLRLEYYGMLPLTKVAYDNINFYVLIDTGFDGFLGMNEQTIKQSSKYKKVNKIVGQGKRFMTVNGISKGKQTLITVDTLLIGNKFISSIPTYVSQDKPLLGSALLRGFNVIYNFSDSIIFLTPYDFQGKKDLVKFGLSIELNEKHEILVAFVWENTNAYKNGIRVGQRIVKINNTETGNINLNDFCNLMTTLLNQSPVLELTILNKEKYKQVSLNKE
jgi:predicted aspartyl protease